MFEKRVIDARLRKLDQCLIELKELGKVGLKTYLEDARMQAVVERYFQVAIQACMDMANYIIARKRLRLPEKEENLFVTLGRAGIIPAELGNRIKGLVRFRNILVHDYLEIDPRKVHRLLKTRLGDLAAFAKAIAEFLERSDSV